MPEPSANAVRTGWRVVGWLLVAAVVWLSLTGTPPQDVSPWDWDKANHFVAYFVLTGWFVQLRPTVRGRLLVAAAFFTLGGALEIAQGMGGVRYGEWADLLANGLGVLAAWALAPTPLGRILPALERVGG